MDELLSKEELSQLIDEVKKLENSVLLGVIKSKRDNAKEACATMPVYDNESIANREFTRGYGIVTGKQKYRDWETDRKSVV